MRLEFLLFYFFCIFSSCGFHKLQSLIALFYLWVFYFCFYHPYLVVFALLGVSSSFFFFSFDVLLFAIDSVSFFTFRAQAQRSLLQLRPNHRTPRRPVGPGQQLASG